MEFLSNELKMPHLTSNSPCWLCEGNRSDRNIRDVSPNAPWKATIPMPNAPPSQHPLWRAPGLHKHHCPGDAMHICDCKGVSAHLLGSGLWQLVLEGHQHIQGSQDERVRLLWVAIQRILLEQQVESRIFQLTNEMIYSGPQNWAVLSSSVKAATTRALVPVVRQLCEELHTGSAVSTHRILAFRAMEEFYKILEKWLRPPPCRERQTAWGCRMFLLHYNILIQSALTEGAFLYNQVNKHHYYWHVADQAKWLNPRSSWAYSYENFI